MPLLTWHGQLVRLNRDGRTLSPADWMAADSPLDIDPAAAQQDHPALGGIVLAPGPRAGTLLISRYSRFLTRSATGAALSFGTDDPACALPMMHLSAEQLVQLRRVVRTSWIIRETRGVIGRDSVALRDGFVVAFGDLTADLADLIRRPDAPAELTLAQPGRPGIGLVAALPRSSALADTAIWPVRARRQAEVAVLAAHRHAIGHEPEQAVLEADVARLLDGNGFADVGALLADSRASAVADGQSCIPVQEALRTIEGWALREAAPWLIDPAPRAEADAVHQRMNASYPWAFLYRFAGGTVELLDKPDGAGTSADLANRAVHYLGFFRRVAARLPCGFATTLCLCVSDKTPPLCPAPLFGFQKTAGSRLLLLPDINFLADDFYEAEAFHDDIAFDDKTATAVFAGSTSGAPVTLENIRAATHPRVAAAAYFDGNARVDFRLPNIVQSRSAEAEAMLRARAFCQKPRLSWAEQFRHRFILSMDGNGATCSRVAVALFSRSVLMKYDSPELLYYFPALQPWVHHVPVARDSDVEAVLRLADHAPERFGRIALNGRSFARTYLTRHRVEHYMAALLMLHEECHTDAPKPEAPPNKAARPGGLRAVAHVQQRGDVWSGPDGWVGEPGSSLPIEGVGLFLIRRLRDCGLQQQIAVDETGFGQDIEGGAFAGARGSGRPLLGLRLSVDPEHEVTLEARLVDGRTLGLVRGASVEVLGDVALECLRVGVAKIGETP